MVILNLNSSKKSQREYAEGGDVMNNLRWDQSVACFLVLSSEGSIIECNQTFCDFLEYRKEELLGKHIEYVLNNAGKFFFHSILYPKLRMAGHIGDIYLQLQTKDKVLKDCLFNAKLFSLENKQVIDCVIFPVSRQIKYEKELKEINNRLEHVLMEKDMLHDRLLEKQQELLALNKELKLYATRDELTQLYNRRIFLDYLGQMIERFTLDGDPFSIMLLDVDYFKCVNDQYGHSIGDDVLSHLAHKMVHSQHKTFINARFGGEEFVVLMPGLTEIEAIEKAESLRKTVEHDRSFVVPITISVGVATVSRDEDSDTLILKADKAMYKAKQTGRNKVVHYNQIARH